MPIIVPRGGGRLLLRRGFDAVREIAPGEEIARRRAVACRRPRPAITAAAASWARAGPALGYVITGTRRIYHAGDTDLFDGMRAIGATGLDLALVPIWGWGSRLGPGHLDPLRAAQALALLHAAPAVPIHWGTYAVGPSRPSDRRAYLRAPLASRSWRPRASWRRGEVVPLEPGESLEL